MSTVSRDDPTPEEIASRRIAAERMFAEIEGKPCVLVQPSGGVSYVYLIGTLDRLRLEVDCVAGRNKFIGRNDSWPDELLHGDEFMISEDCLEVDSEWWRDTSRNEYLVFAPDKVARSFAGDDAWVESCLGLQGTTRRR